MYVRRVMVAISVASTIITIRDGKIYFEFGCWKYGCATNARYTVAQFPNLGCPAVFEINVLFCASAGCKDPKNGAPGYLFMCYSLLKSWETHAHIGCTGFKIHAPGSQNVHTGCRVHP